MKNENPVEFFDYEDIPAKQKTSPAKVVEQPYHVSAGKN